MKTINEHRAEIDPALAELAALVCPLAWQYEGGASVREASITIARRMQTHIADLVAQNERLHERLMSEQCANLDLKRTLLKIGPPDLAVNWRKPSVIGGLVILIVIAGDLIGSWPKSLF